MNLPAANAPLEHDRLFGLLAVQNGFARIADVLRALTTGESVAERLEAERLVSAEERRLIDDLVRRSIERHGDVARALVSLNADSVLPREPARDTESGAFEPTLGKTFITPPSRGGNERTESQSDEDPDLASTLASSAMTSSAGAELATVESRGRYSYVRELGKGGQSLVRVAYDRDVGREIAIKELLDTRRDTSNAVARFVREARIAGQLEHPNIVPIYELGRREDGAYYCAQKLVRGRTFGQALWACRGLDDRLKLLPHFEDLCQGLAYAHSRNVVHRDLKPENVMVGEFGETVVLDWGLAKARGQRDLRGAEPAHGLEELRSGSVAATLEGSVIGTPSYMSPEQALGNSDDIDERSDVWALGVMLFEILTGRVPFQGSSPFDVIEKVARAPIPQVRELVPEAPRDLAAIAQKALTRDRAQRYANAKELADEIQAFRLGQRVAAYEYSSLELLRRFVAKNKVLSAIVLAALVLVSAAGGVALMRDRESRRNLARAFVEKARVAERDLRWGEAAVFRAAARTYDSAADLPLTLRFEGAFEAEPVARLAGHQGPIDFIAVSPTEPLLVSGSRDQTIGFWDLSERKLLARVPAHPNGSYVMLTFSPSGRTVASISDDGQVIAWDPHTRTPRVTLSLDKPRPVLALTPDDRLLATATQGAVVLFDLENRAVVRQWPVDQPVTSLIFVAGGTQLVTAHANGAMRRWDVATGEALAGFAGHSQWIAFLRLDHDGKLLTSVSDDRRVGIWDVASGKPVAMLEGHQGAVAESAFSPDGKLLASVGNEGAIRVWDVATRAGVGTLNVPGVSLSTVGFSPDGSLLAAAGSDHVLRLWKVPSPFRIDAIDPGAHDLVHSPDGRLLAFVSPDTSIGIWDLAAGALAMRVPGHPLMSNLMAFSLDGRRLVVRGGPDARIWDLPSRTQIFTVSDYPDQMLSLALGPTGQTVALGLINGKVGLWDVEGHRELAMLDRKAGNPIALSFSPDGGTLAARYTDGGLVLWDLATHAPRTARALASSGVEFFRFLSDGSALWQGEDHVAHRWDLERDAEVARFAGHGAPLASVSLSADRRQLLSADDASVRVWDLESGAPIGVRDHHWAQVSSVAFSPTAGWLTVAGADGRLRRFEELRLPPAAEHLSKMENKFALRLEGIELVEAAAAPAR
jgi:WD40 repeat protein